jgi:hypothetical protein
MAKIREELYVTCGYCGNYAQMIELGSAGDTKKFEDKTGSYEH